MGAKRGVNTSSIEMSPRKKARLAKARKREEAKWAAKFGPVVVRKIDPE